MLPIQRRLFSASTAARTTPKSIAQFLQTAPAARIENTSVSGYVRSSRKYKTEQFVDLGDGSSLKSLQAVMPRSLGADGLVADGRSIRVGSAVRLNGSWVPCENQEKQTHELKVSSVEVIGPSDPKTYPIQKKYQSLEYLRSMPHLRSRIPMNAALLRMRSDTITALTSFFESQNFTQTHPPLITSSDCEGAGEVFTVASGTPEEQARPKKKAADHFFRGPKYLTVSTQLHLEALAQSVGNVWTLSPSFRAEQSDTSRHMSEFYMLEAEMTFVQDMETVMDLVENMLRSTVSSLQQSASSRDLRAAVSALRHEEPELISDAELDLRWAGMANAPQRWPRITYAEALELLHEAQETHGSGYFATPAPEWKDGLASEHEKWLAETISAKATPGWKTPVFVTHYPRESKAFYMLPSGNSSGRETVDCFDLLVPDMCEIAGGSMREHRLENLLDTMKQRGMALPTGVPGRSTSGLDWYIDLRRWGSPPHGGFGLGFDRLMSYLSGIPNVKDVVAFPRWYSRCDC
ncbi:hypothetical protein TD95_000551 [Thielaviopsis punctulata]|uniref:asparagine--tRNA ligase n=1 Tax=Thielaviopsis punctulata TaxID=72032 RepID=A0A0F4ZAY4_9PEZI|nr:hypothetical protein TD95_000551 [Thielaviopsis punctulata]